MSSRGSAIRDALGPTLGAHTTNKCVVKLKEVFFVVIYLGHSRDFAAMAGLRGMQSDFFWLSAVVVAASVAASRLDGTRPDRHAARQGGVLD